MKQVWKKRAVVAAVLLFVCAAVYMNWRYAGNLEDTSKVLGQSTLVGDESQEPGTESGGTAAVAAAENDYFSTARLSRKQARDNAISMLKEAETDEHAEQSVLNEASQTLQVLASYTVAETQIENLVKDADGLDAADVARVKDIVMQETSYKPDQIKVIESE